MTRETFLFFSKTFIWFIWSECLSPHPGGYVAIPLEFWYEKLVLPLVVILDSGILLKCITVKI